MRDNSPAAHIGLGIRWSSPLAGVQVPRCPSPRDWGQEGDHREAQGGGGHVRQARHRGRLQPTPSPLCIVAYYASSSGPEQLEAFEALWSAMITLLCI